MSMPSWSKKRIMTDCVSCSKSRTVMPPRLRPERTWKRVTGTVATSRSSTFTPAALQPTIMARLSTRAARDVSREAVMVLPFSSVLAHAIDSRMTSSGLMSTLARPVTPRRPKRVRAPATPTRSRC